MSTKSPESVISDRTEDMAFSKRDIPRKRSKVSRACDACRRKKIRCNAEYLSTLLRVTKLCTNCTKTGEECLFSRVPMKRGPSKGYIRDLVDHMDSLEKRHGMDSAEDSSNCRPRLKLVDLAGSNVFTRQGSTADSVHTYPPSSASQNLLKPQFSHLPAFSPAPQMTQPIILPPLVGAQPLTQPVKLSLPIPKYSVSVSPQTNGAPIPNLPNAIHNTNPGENPNHRIQGPLWKVPYEMPVSGTPRSLASSPSGSNIGSFDSRRSSIDSVTSTPTSRSTSRPPSFQAGSYFSEVEDTDSGRSEAPSRRNSISSMLLLNGRAANTPNISQSELNFPQVQHAKTSKNEHSSQLLLPPHAQFFSYPLQPPLQQGALNFKSPTFPIQAQPNSNPYLPSSSTPINACKATGYLDYNLKEYYRGVHSAFPILLSDGSEYLKIITELQNSSLTHSQIIQFFSVALDNLVRHQLIPFDAVRSLLLHFTSIYPFDSSDIPCRNEVIHLMFAGLLLINLTILLRGDSCPTGISLAHGAFTDFKVLQTFKHLSPSRIQELHRDDIQLYLPRLYLCLRIIDDCHALAWGTQSQVPKYSNFLLASLTPTFPQKQFNLQFLENVELGNLFGMLEDMKCEEMFFERPRSKKSPSVSSLGERFSNSSSALILFSLQRDKYELFDFASEICSFFENHLRIDYEDEYTKDHIQDYQLKTSRLVKKLSQSILNFARHVSNNESQLSSHGEIDQISPFFNISFGQSFRLIKISKEFLESLVENAGDNEIISRCIKIIKDLSHATTLLSTKLNISSTGNESVSSVHLVACGPGVMTAQIISRKLEIYDLTFRNTISIQLNKADKKSIETWRDDFLKTSKSLVYSEDMDGWL